VRMLTGFICLGNISVSGPYEHGNEPSGPVKGVVFLDQHRAKIQASGSGGSN
jgi:hypothetical protein